MKNKMELMVAAQNLAASDLTTTSPLALDEKKIANFQTLGIADEHYSDFVNWFNASRAQYLAMASQPVKPATPPAPAPPAPVPTESA